MRKPKGIRARVESGVMRGLHELTLTVFVVSAVAQTFAQTFAQNVRRVRTVSAFMGLRL